MKTLKTVYMNRNRIFWTLVVVLGAQWVLMRLFGFPQLPDKVSLVILGVAMAIAALYPRRRNDSGQTGQGGSG